MVRLLTGAQGHQAYIMAALMEEGSRTPIPGYELEHCIITNAASSRLQLKWDPAPSKAVAPGTRVQLRLVYRTATVYALE